jgi:argininosuccinate synthase
VRISELQGHKVGICVSGGLDSKTVATALVKRGIDVLCFTADLGQPDETDIEDVRRRMAATGAETVIVDLREDMARACLFLVRTQATYDGGYWNTTGIARAVTVRPRCRRAAARCCPTARRGAAMISSASSATRTCSPR